MPANEMATVYYFIKLVLFERCIHSYTWHCPSAPLPFTAFCTLNTVLSTITTHPNAIHSKWGTFLAVHTDPDASRR